jgi:hypothetical protein
MLSLFLAIQSQVAGRPSGPGYVLTLAGTAVIAGVVIAFITSRFNRPKTGAERSATKIDAPRAVGDRLPPSPERAPNR